MRRPGPEVLLAAAALLCAATPFDAMADTAITSVSLEITSDITAGEEGGDVEVSSSSSRYDVDQVEIRNEPSNEWDEGDEPRIRVTLSADSGYYFDSGFSESDVSLSGDEGDVTSVSRSRKELKINITLAELSESYYDGEYDLDVSGLELDDTDGTAYWDEAEDARRYEVRLYRNGDSITSIKTTDDTDYDFSDEFTRSGDYSFRVRAVRNSSNKGNWEESDEIYVSSSEAREIRNSSSSSSGSSSSGPGVSSGGPGVSSGGGPGMAYTGAWMWDSGVSRWWYCNADRTYTVNNWQYINNIWYYFDSQGYMVTGWQYINNNWYYMNSQGAMLTGWQYINGYWYYLNSQGAMVTGWIQTGGRWYYCVPNGEMLTNSRTPDGYYVGSNGAWIQGY